MWSKHRMTEQIECMEKFSAESRDEWRLKILAVYFSECRIMKAIAVMESEAIPGPDGNSPILLRLFSKQLSVTLSKIYTDSMETGKFLSILKLSYITPVNKPGKLNNHAESFYPVSMTCQLGKIMEIVVHEDL